MRVQILIRSLSLYKIEKKGSNDHARRRIESARGQSCELDEIYFSRNENTHCKSTLYKTTVYKQSVIFT